MLRFKPFSIYKVQGLPVDTYIIAHEDHLCAYIVEPDDVDRTVDATYEFACCTFQGCHTFLAEHAELPEDTQFLGVDTGHLWNEAEGTTKSALDAIQQISEVLDSIYPDGNNITRAYHYAVTKLGNNEPELTEIYTEFED